LLFIYTVKQELSSKTIFFNVFCWLFTAISLSAGNTLDTLAEL